MSDSVTSTHASRLLSPEEIAVRGGIQIDYVRLAERRSVFADRELRLREKAASHAMRDFLMFMAELARAQHELLQAFPVVTLPSKDDLDAAARGGQPPLPAPLWPRDPAWCEAYRSIIDRVLPRLQGSPVQSKLETLRDLPAERLEQQADRLLSGVMLGLDMAAAPLIAAALQTYWTHMCIALGDARLPGAPEPFGRTDDPTACPACGSRPTASVLRIGADSSGYRYLHCSLCSTEWHMVRIKCSHCQGTKGINYESAERAGRETPNSAARGTASKPAVEAETCDDCGHYLKIVHMERDPGVEPVADDLASVTLDLLVSDAGFQRHGVNLMLLFGDPEGADDPPDPGAP